jgi:hypothetical protein
MNEGSRKMSKNKNGWKKDRTVRNELKRATDKVKKEYLESISVEIKEFK